MTGRTVEDCPAVAVSSVRAGDSRVAIAGSLVGASSSEREISFPAVLSADTAQTGFFHDGNSDDSSGTNGNAATARNQIKCRADADPRRNTMHKPRAAARTTRLLIAVSRNHPAVPAVGTKLENSWELISPSFLPGLPDHF